MPADRQSRLRSIPLSGVCFMRSIWRYGQVMSGLLPAFGLGMAVLAGSAQAQTAPIRVQDDRGRAVVLAEPARRAVTLAPHATELVCGWRRRPYRRHDPWQRLSAGRARAAGHRRWHATGRGTRGRRPARPDHRLATGRRRTAGPRHGQAGRAGLLQRPADTGGHPRRGGTDGRAVRHPGPGSARRQGCANGWTGWPRAMPTAGRCGSSSRPGWIPSTR